VSQGLKMLERLLTPEILNWLIAGAKTAVVLIAVATILQTWGIQVAPIIAGLGLFGVAVALGAQDLFKNLIGGMSILIERRFGFGDWIKVDGVVEGTVEKIGFRSTLVRQFDKAPVYVPNQHLSDNSVINYSAMTYRRISWLIGVEYRTTHERLQRICEDIEAYISSTEDFAQPPAAPLFVRIDSFGPSSIDILVYCFTRSTSWGDWLEVKQALAYRIKQIVEGAGTGFAFPSQSVYLETLPPAIDEIVASRKE
ncbi:MAG: mechanosensitive ion channel family protein, partial [Parvibaculaceae bacterium]